MSSCNPGIQLLLDAARFLEMNPAYVHEVREGGTMPLTFTQAHHTTVNAGLHDDPSDAIDAVERAAPRTGLEVLATAAAIKYHAQAWLNRNKPSPLHHAHQQMERASPLQLLKAPRVRFVLKLVPHKPLPKALQSRCTDKCRKEGPVASWCMHAVEALAYLVEAVPAHYSARNVAIAAVLTEITKRPFGRKHISTKVQSSNLRAGTATGESLLDGWITDGDKLPALPKEVEELLQRATKQEAGAKRQRHEVKEENDEAEEKAAGREAEEEQGEGQGDRPEQKKDEESKVILRFKRPKMAEEVEIE